MTGCHDIPEVPPPSVADCEPQCFTKCTALGYFTQNANSGQHLMPNDDGSMIIDMDMYSNACKQACIEKCMWQPGGFMAGDTATPPVGPVDTLDCQVARDMHFPFIGICDMGNTIQMDLPEEYDACYAAAMAGCQDYACLDSINLSDPPSDPLFWDSCSPHMSIEQCVGKHVRDCEMSDCFSAMAGDQAIQSVCQPCIEECSQKCSAIYGDTETDCEVGCMSSCHTYGGNDMHCPMEAETHCGYAGPYPECHFAACNPPTECYESFALGCQLTVPTGLPVDGICSDVCLNKCDLMYDTTQDGLTGDFEHPECNSGCFDNCSLEQGAGDCQMMANSRNFDYCNDPSVCMAAFVKGCEANECVDQATMEKVDEFFMTNQHLTRHPHMDMYVKRSLFEQCEKQKCYSQAGTPQQCDPCFSQCQTKCQSV